MTDRDDLIVDILEKVSDKVNNISAEQIRQSVVLEFNTKVLEEHARRSSASEARLELLEKDSQFVRNLIKICAALGAITTLIIKTLPLLH